jgi:hypothetical protein
MPKIFPAEQLSPVRATMSAKLGAYFDYAEFADDAYDEADDQEGSPLYYQLLIELAPGHVTGDDPRNVNKEIELDDIIFHVADWRSLDLHPLSATGDNVAGIFYLFGVHNPVEISQITFRLRDKNTFTMDATLLIDLEDQPEGFGIETIELWDVPVRFVGLSFYQELLPDEKADAEAARTFAGQFVPLEAYAEAPTFDEEFVYFAPKLT